MTTGVTLVGARGKRRRWLRALLLALIPLLILVAFLFYRYPTNRPVTYSGIEDHFKYGSIGSDIENGMPLRVIKVLPRMFPQYLPEGAVQDLTAFGFVQEPGKEMPIGFSQRKRLLDVTGLNCASCHVGVVRESEQSEPQLILGMQSNTVDLQAFLEFLFASAGDERFTPDNILAEMEKDGSIFPTDRLLYRFAVNSLREGLLKRRDQLARFMTPDHPRFGPGRVDTFNFYKVNQFAEHYAEPVLPEEERFGTAKFPSIWNQKVREDMNSHWDGNNSSVRVRNFSAAIGAGATCKNVDSQALDRVRTWFAEMPPPPYPYARTDNAQQLERGRVVYDEYCAECHSLTGSAIGQIVPLEEIGTDENRLNSYTEKTVSLQLNYCKGYESELSTFKKTNGYVNQPLDGVWARAPYLHNGSVPTMWDLLTPAEQRNNNQDSFYTGHGVYDTENMGFRTDVGAIDGRQSFRFDLTQRGNSNKGHTGARYGTELSDEDKRALIEYLKTQ